MQVFRNILKNSTILPFDNYSSITLDNCDFIIRYENINEDYKIHYRKLV